MVLHFVRFVRLRSAGGASARSPFRSAPAHGTQSGLTPRPTPAGLRAGAPKSRERAAIPLLNTPPGLQPAPDLWISAAIRVRCGTECAPASAPLPHCAGLSGLVASDSRLACRIWERSDCFGMLTAGLAAEVGWARLERCERKRWDRLLPAAAGGRASTDAAVGQWTQA